MPHYHPHPSRPATKRNSLLELIQKMKIRRLMTLFLTSALTVSILLIVTFTLHAAAAASQRSSGTAVVIKLHNSEQRFVEEALHGIVLVPKKLAPTKSPAVALKEMCAKLNKGKCRNCNNSSSSSSSSSRNKAEVKAEVPAGGQSLLELPRPKDVWAARRREWREEEGMQKVRQKLLLSLAGPGNRDGAAGGAGGGGGGGQFRKSVDIMNVNLPPRLPNFRNPCFLMPARPMTQCSTGPFRQWRRVSHTYRQGVVWDPKSQVKRRLRCLPYFVILGLPRSGASELLHALSHHRDVTHPLPFQSRWLESARFEALCASVNTYLDFFDWSAQIINKRFDRTGFHTTIIGEVAENLLWDNHFWPVLPGNEGQLEPRYTNADYLHHLDPDVKVIIILRDPTERLYEEYQKAAAEQQGVEASPEDFHSRVTYSLDVLRTCLSTQPLRSCVYDGVHDDSDTAVGVRAGLYVPMVQDWLRVFPRQQLHVLHYETFRRRIRIEMIKLVQFLDLKGVTLAQIEAMIQRAGTVEKRKKRKRKPEAEKEEEEEEEEGEEMERWRQGLKDLLEQQEKEKDQMLQETREMLDGFYKPFNRLLATLLEDDAFLWER
ncbi:carbohydrate sulfotransferase 15-like [Babylonia areolata]|uniref:carbohydrate sulfotransferase 15-like n=1 Tax=Babylonia areolata TaxID=304850 RepID=UPI003FD5635B